MSEVPENQSEIQYPNINFTEKDTSIIVNNLINSFETATGGKLGPADPRRLFIIWVADIVNKLKVDIDFSAKQNLPRFAEDKYLDSLAEIFRNVKRLEPSYATTKLCFEISEPQINTYIVPADVRATPDGQIYFETLEELKFTNGSTTAIVASRYIPRVTGQGNPVSPLEGNGFLPGQINQIVDPFKYFESVYNTETTAGGAERESDIYLRRRMSKSQESYSTAGPEGAGL